MSFVMPGKTILSEFLLFEGNRLVLLELHPVSCAFKLRENKTFRTREWIQAEHWEEILDLLTPIVMQHFCDLGNPEEDAAKKPGKNKILHADVQVGKTLKIAWLFKPCLEARDVKLVIPMPDGCRPRKQYIHGQKIVASVAIQSESPEEEMLTAKSIHTSIGSLMPDNLISQYFTKG